MGNNEARGDDLVKKAERKLFGWVLFRNKYEDAADLLEKAAIFLRIAKNWSRAAGVYNKIADCHLKGYHKYECIYRKHEAAYAYVEAATCYKKFSPKDAAQALIDAVNLFLEFGELTMAATYNEDIGEIYQQEQDLENAAVCLNRAADLYDSNGDSFELDKIAKKIAEINAQLEKYQEAAELFEEIARKSKYGVSDFLLNAGICQLCRDDPIAIHKLLVHYQDIDRTFSRTHEYKLLMDLAASIDEGDIAKFTDAIKEFDSRTALVPWKTTLIVKMFQKRFEDPIPQTGSLDIGVGGVEILNPRDAVDACLVSGAIWLPPDSLSH